MVLSRGIPINLARLDLRSCAGKTKTAYMYDAHHHNACLCSAHCYASCHSFAQVNTEIVAIQRVITPAGESQLKELIQAHADKTGSAKAAALLADWSAASQRFWQVGTV